METSDEQKLFLITRNKCCSTNFRLPDMDITNAYTPHKLTISNG